MRLKPTALAVVLLASASAAHAELIPLARSGGWTALGGYGGEKQSTAMCVMSIAGSHDRHLMIKWQQTSNKVFVHVFKQSWRIPAGTDMPMQIVFDRAVPFSGLAKTVNGDPTGVELWIANAKGDGSYSEIKSFMNQFRDADKMYVVFPGGSEPTWTVNMDGSEKIARHFWNCVGEANARNSTQPHRGGDATQPYGRSAPAPTQPHAPAPAPTQSGRRDI